ncbi:MAG: chloride channel protein [Bacteroidales bacterium]|nr:chloride channel protein [Bacteroidales bacterium]
MTFKPHQRLLALQEKTRLLILAFLVGIFSGLAAVLLHFLIKIIRDGLSSAVMPFSAALFYLVLPGIGMFVSGLLVRLLIKDNIGHGVTQVLVAVTKKEWSIKPHNMWSSILTSSITIGFGGSVGAEAPIVYTGAAIGSNFARWMGMSYRSATVLLGCGAAGAIAGIFKAPLAGILFTLEILLFNISMSSIMPLLFSTVSATVVSYLLTGMERPFACDLTPFSMVNMPFYLILGIFCGFCSVYFLRTTLKLEDLLSRLRNPYVRWTVCAVSLGVLILLFPPLFGEGYDSLMPFLNGMSPDPEDGAVVSGLAGLMTTTWGVPLFFLLVMLLKVFSMTFTNAGGGVGGTFGPTLIVGALAGFVIARTLNLLLASTSLTLPEQNFALVGMAGLMAGVMQAPMTAIFLIAEITGGYDLLLPLILTATVSFGITRFFEHYSIYSKRIAATGELLTHDNDQAVLTLLKVNDLVETDFIPVSIDATLGDLVKAISRSSRNIFPILDSKGHFQGYVSLENVRTDMFNTDLYNIRHVYNYLQTAPEQVYENESMDSVMKKFEISGAWNLPVMRNDKSYIGFVSKSKIFSSYREELRELSRD